MTLLNSEAQLEHNNEDCLTKAEEILGITFVTKDLLIEALTHSSATSEDSLGNGRLTFVGCEMMRLVGTEHIWREARNPKSVLHEMPIRVLTEINSKVLSREHLGEVAKRIGINEVIILGKGMEQFRSKLSVKQLADILRAVVGAILIDQGQPVAWGQTREWLLQDFDQNLETNANSPTHGKIAIERVIQIARQRYGKGDFSYQEINQRERIMQDHRSIVMGAYFNGKLLGVGKGKTKKIAKQRSIVNAHLHQEKWPE